MPTLLAMRVRVDPSLSVIPLIKRESTGSRGLGFLRIGPVVRPYLVAIIKFAQSLCYPPGSEMGRQRLVRTLTLRLMAYVGKGY